MTAVRAALAGFAVMLASGCATPTSWNPLRWVGIMDAPANQPTPLAEIRATVTPRAVWTTSVGKASGFRFRPDAEGGRIYTAAADGVVTVLDEGGRVVARHDTRKKLSGGVRVAGDKILVGTIKGEAIALDANGRTAWTTLLAGEIIAPAAVSRNTAVVRTSD